MNGAPTTLELLTLRHHALRQVRSFFDARGFLEVTTPLLSSETFADRYLEPFRVTLLADPTQPMKGPTWYLQTSPELHMKRLLAAGAPAIYQITQAFRAGELGPRHNPEFSILEWYRVGDDYAAGRRLLADFLREMLNDSEPISEFTYAELFERWVGVDPHAATGPTLKELAHAQGVQVAEMLRGDLLDVLMTLVVEPRLAQLGLVFVYDYPSHQSALAATRPDRSGIAERFEAYFNGVELANGYHELGDVEEIRRRHQANCQFRVSQGRQPFAEPSHFTKAIEQGFPRSSGVALGFDRLLMTKAGIGQIGQVQVFPLEKA